MEEPLQFGISRARKRRSWQMLLPRIGEAPACASGARKASVRCSAMAVVMVLDFARAVRPELPCWRGVPLVHLSQHFVGLVDRQVRSLGDHLEILVRDDGGDLDDVIAVGLEARHFEIDQDQVLGAGHRRSVLFSVMARECTPSRPAIEDLLAGLQEALKRRAAKRYSRPPPPMTQTPPFNARIIAVYGRDLLVRDAAGTALRARPKGRKMDLVCGDDVLCERDAAHDEISVVQTLPRRTALYRSNLRGVAEAAHGQRVAAVCRAGAQAVTRPVCSRSLCRSGDDPRTSRRHWS